MEIDENGKVTIKCNKHFSTKHFNCYNRSTSLCPFRMVDQLQKPDNNCYNGIVTLNWLDYIAFNNYMTQEFKKD